VSGGHGQGRNNLKWNNKSGGAKMISYDEEGLR
jgi:hypothetical protein